MLPRIELIAAIDGVADNAELTIKEIADILKHSDNTVGGWLSNRNDFPIAALGARKKKHYTKRTFIKMCLYAYAINPIEDVPKIQGHLAIKALNGTDPIVALNLLREGHSEFSDIFYQNA